MTSAFTKDAKIIREYCSAPSRSTEKLQGLSVEAVELFLQAVRESHSGSAIEADLEQIRRKRVEECLGKRVVDDIVRDFQSAISIVSWNVNGLRSRILDDKLSSDKSLKYTKKGGWPTRSIQAGSPLDLLIKSPEIRANILCIQETKLTQEMESIFKSDLQNDGWYTTWNSSACTNYSGVSTWVYTPLEDTTLRRNV